MQVIYQDNHLLALDKPGGLLTQPSGTQLDSLEDQAKNWLKETLHKPGAVFLEAVHRIDRVACGVVLFAKTSKALSRMNTAIRNGECTKEYRVIVETSPLQPHGCLRNWLLHGDHEARVLPREAPGAKQADLSYELLERRPDGMALLRVMLGSGRYHQIRAQLAYAGMPILGDTLYGARKTYRPGAIALQHYRLTVCHPVTHQELALTSFHSL